MKDYLISFTYDHYCQGYEDAHETILVRNCSTFFEACEKIKNRYENARDFKNKEIL